MNAAVTAARLGAPTAFVGRISTDEHGDAIWDFLLASGVTLAAAQRGPEPTARAIVELSPGPVFRFEGEGTADASMTDLDLAPLGPGPHLLHGGTLGIFRGSTAEVLARLIEAHEGIVSFDPNVRPQIIDDRARWFRYADRWIDRADLVKGSDEDFGWMGLGPAELLDRGVVAVLRTLGGDGVELHRVNEAVRHVLAPAVEVVDAVGAGDAICGSVLVGLWERDITDRTALAALDDAAWDVLLAFAVEVAAITVGRPGADPPYRSDVPV